MGVHTPRLFQPELRLALERRPVAVQGTGRRCEEAQRVDVRAALRQGDGRQMA